MKVIAGKFGGLNLSTVKGRNTRPTSAKVKESMFNMLSPYLHNVTKGVDLFAGTGALGIEAVSRGVETMYLVDQNRQAINVIKDNIAKTHATNEFTVWSISAQKAVQRLLQSQTKMDLLLLDPPYAQHVTLQLIQECLPILTSQALVLIETDYDLHEQILPGFSTIASKQYGLTFVEIWQYEGI
ncbi:16S rRNA (guanine(966)-N(2))-methyltransferase RsmD [Bombilactobacillus thymidiniphilus]|uniref:16S rRNA (Guanine(966)-N(2))-methyltransferase RsmD n=1 Tax=Bombilactobacillus thymidiniphilus TaxID=2923363 RepID=A0ABY4PDK4_9LACO|nr:16S rRNA (guanine(966)-N(2))-methyltransferase RsmD [Bombilactobacillus thymidiniphilus]UQS83759.1 16S rRNA (guanine(966)-N(2))-methyltransferase RsmD [Bombilactobacillus thymidiniphilus]